MPIEDPPAPSSDHPVERGLQVAFGRRDAVRDSVLRRLGHAAGKALGLHLHGGDDAGEAPVVVDDEARALRDPAGRYQVLGEIGRGGVGIVYKGRDQDLGRDVAMKVLRAEYAENPEILERFVEEAQIGGQLQHPGIVPVYELGLQHGERPYFAMKLIKGETLAAQLRRRTHARDDLHRLLGAFEQVCQTLAYAHSRRVVHRDLKPANVMIGGFGEVQVVDWDFAKVLAEGGIADEARPVTRGDAASVINTVRSDPKRGSHSVAGSMLGTPAYMPPEQATGAIDLMDRRSDVFGLGAILCEVLTGAPPYRDENGDVVQQAARADQADAHARLDVCGADAVLVALCKQCLAPAPRARPESAQQVASAIASYTASVAQRAHDAQIRAAEARVRSRAAVLLAVATMLLLAVGGGGFVYVREQRNDRATAATALVAAAMNDASLRLGEARAVGGADLAPWQRASDAAANALRLAADDAVAARERTKVSELARTINAEFGTAVTQARQQARDARMRQQLLEARILPQETDSTRRGWREVELQRREAAYDAAFREYLGGTDLDDLSVEAAATGLRGPIAGELGIELCAWGMLRQRLGFTYPWGPEKAIAHVFAVAAALVPDDPRAARLRQLSGQLVCDREHALSVVAELDGEGIPAVAYSLLASVLIHAGAQQDAKRVLKLGCRRYANDVGLFLDTAHALESDDGEAELHYRIAIALRPESRAARLGYANCLSRRGDHDAAIAEYRICLDLDPRFLMARNNLGCSLRELGLAAEAKRCFDQCIADDPGFALAHYNLGHGLHRAGQVTAAIAMYRRAAELDWAYVPTHVNLGNLLRDSGQLDLAADSFRKALAIAPKDTIVLNNFGNLLRVLGRLDESAQLLREVARALADAPHVHANLGLTLHAQGKLREAVASFRRAQDLDRGPDTPMKRVERQWFLADALVKLGRADEAIAEYRWLLVLDPKHVGAQLELGRLLRESGKPGGALLHLEAARELDPFGSDAPAQIAEIQAGCGRIDDAIASFRAAIDRDPWHLHANARLAFLLHDRNPGEAIAHYRRAIALAPTSADLHNSLGLALRQRCRYDEALVHFRSAQALWQARGDAVSIATSQIVDVVRELDAKMQIWARHLAIARGELEPELRIEAEGAAWMAQQRREFAMAARAWERAFAGFPALLDRHPLRYNAACAAALAACGDGDDAATTLPAERDALRQLARAWLAAEADHWRAQRSSGRLSATEERRRLHWALHDPDLDGVRAAHGLRVLPANEADSWRSFWRETARALGDASMR